MTDAEFQFQIVSWFEKSARDLPWRKRSDAYGIWISEMMLQQTTVQTVIPFYLRFMERFSTIYKLAEASEAEVLKYWEGLGYYRRAKNLRLAAQIIVKEFGGELPSTKEELLKLPGIGPYSAGAILSIAFRRRAPALDGNLIRVYSRFFGIKQDVSKPKTLKSLWTIAERLAPNEVHYTRSFAEGMMDLGATICTPKNANCEICPLSKSCTAKALDLVEALPVKKKSPPRIKHYEVAHFHLKKNKIALLPPGKDSRYPDFYKIPVSRLKRKLSARPDLKYAITTRDYFVWINDEVCDLPKSIKWISLSKINNILLPAIDRKILALKNRSGSCGRK